MILLRNKYQNQKNDNNTVDLIYDIELGDKPILKKLNLLVIKKLKIENLKVS